MPLIYLIPLVAADECATFGRKTSSSNQATYAAEISEVGPIHVYLFEMCIAHWHIYVWPVNIS